MGRFAPSPSGPLHFGSLVAAVASYVDARHHQGRWLVRMEDLDPPREQAGASTAILKSLQAHHLFWDGEVLLQSQRLDAYGEALKKLQQSDLIYPCYCTRKSLAAVAGPYPGTCRRGPVRQRPHAWRVLNQKPSDKFNDVILGPYHCENPLGDFIVRRKDGLFAYQLAVVVDDIYQGITHVIRGIDLIDSTPSQIFLFQCLNAEPPGFGHVPVVLNEQGQKLSKQHGAPPLDDKNSRGNLLAALHFLNHKPDSLSPNHASCSASEEELLNWAIKHWDRKKLPRKNTAFPFL